MVLKGQQSDTSSAVKEAGLKHGSYPSCAGRMIRTCIAWMAQARLLCSTGVGAPAH